MRACGIPVLGSVVPGFSEHVVEVWRGIEARPCNVPAGAVQDAQLVQVERRDNKTGQRILVAVNQIGAMRAQTFAAPGQVVIVDVAAQQLVRGGWRIRLCAHGCHMQMLADAHGFERAGKDDAALLPIAFSFENGQGDIGLSLERQPNGDFVGQHFSDDRPAQQRGQGQPARPRRDARL